MGKNKWTRDFVFKSFLLRYSGQQWVSWTIQYMPPTACPGIHKVHQDTMYVPRVILRNLRIEICKDTNWLLKDGHVVLCGFCCCFCLWFIPGRGFSLSGKKFNYCFSWPYKGWPPFSSYHHRSNVSNFILLAIS